MTDEEDALFTRIETVRSMNNGLWMEIVRIAYRYAPEETRNVMRRVNNNDQAIVGMLRELAK